MEEERLLEIISNEVKNIVCSEDIITPEIFVSIFTQKAHDHGLKIDDKLFDEYLDEKVSGFFTLQDKTVQNVEKLSKSTSKAIFAIEEKDDGSLKNILLEVQILKKEMEKLKESLYKDDLTGAYNRKWLYDHCLDQRSHFTCKGVLVVVDLNYFKSINDTYGHVIGDKVLVFIKTQLGKSKAKVIRYGGDEFLLIFENKQNVTEIQKELNVLRESILKKSLKAKNAQFRVSFSFGVEIFKEGDEFEKIIEAADIVMYEDKVQIKKRITGIVV